MVLGRQEERQAELMVGWAELPRSPGHAFYDRPQAVLVEAGFDGFAEARAIVRRATPARATGRCCGGWRPAAGGGERDRDAHGRGPGPARPQAEGQAALEHGMDLAERSGGTHRRALKDGRTRLAYKPEHAVDLDTGAVVAAGAHSAGRGDAATLPDTSGAAGANLAGPGSGPRRRRGTRPSWPPTRATTRGTA